MSNRYSYPPVSPSLPARGIRSALQARLQTNPGATSIIDWLQQSNRWLILLLLFLLIMALFDVRILNSMYTIVRRTIQLILNLIWRILKVIGFVTGNTLEVAGDIIGETSDVAQYTLESVGKTLQSGAVAENNAVQGQSLVPSWPDTNETEFPSHSSGIQPTLSDPLAQDSSVKWCMVRGQSSNLGCMQMNVHDKCQSRNQYRTSTECLQAIALQ
jgi:hypothetical protein